MMEWDEQATVNVAVAEDNSDLRKMLVRLLTTLGYRVVCAASNGAELLHSCGQADVDVAVVDLDMPIVDGLEAAEEMAHEGIPVVLISGLPDLDHLVMDQEPIAVRLTKPVSATAIKDAIDLALASRPPRRAK